MSTPVVQPTSQRSMNVLSRLLLLPQDSGAPGSSSFAELSADVHDVSRDRFDELALLADLNHVIVRGLSTFLDIARGANDDVRAEWAQIMLAAEQARIDKALGFLHEICAAFQHEGHDVAVIKSLDHWPDLGSDLDLYTNAASNDVIRLMQRRFDARIAPRSWGDRLARKWNFALSELPELVEVHIGRLGQTGEQVALASRLMKRARTAAFGSRVFQVPSYSHRIMISTLQRMYRHFYFRLCDIVDSAALADADLIDYDDLQASALDAGIWEGVATYLVIVSDYAKKFRGTGLELPRQVVDAAHFDGAELYFSKDFLRVPILPQSARLYGTQLAGMMRRRELHSGARLSLLPWLATAAVVGQKITGSDKGIW